MSWVKGNLPQTGWVFFLLLLAMVSCSKRDTGYWRDWCDRELAPDFNTEKNVEVCVQALVNPRSSGSRRSSDKKVYEIRKIGKDTYKVKSANGTKRYKVRKRGNKLLIKEK